MKELHGMAKAVGIDLEVCNVYYSGCSLKKHWTWFEVLTGKSCVGNTYVPEYELAKEKMEILQQIAHEAVAKVN